MRKDRRARRSLAPSQASSACTSSRTETAAPVSAGEAATSQTQNPGQWQLGNVLHVLEARGAPGRPDGRVDAYLSPPPEAGPSLRLGSQLLQHSLPLGLRTQEISSS